MARPLSIEWRIAWRHLGVGEARPRWSGIVLVVAAFLVVVGGGMGTYAAVELAAPAATEDALAAFVGSSTSQLQQHYGLFAALTVLAGGMLLIFGVLGRFFNLLASIITFSVMLGCMALVVVLSLMSGFEGDLRDKILNQKAHIRVAAGDGNRFGDYSELVEHIAAADGIAGASPYLDGEVLVRSGVNRQGATLIGVLPQRLRTVSNVHDIMSEGVFESLGDPSLVPDVVRPSAARPTRPWRLRHLEPDDELAPVVTPSSSTGSAPSDPADEDRPARPTASPFQRSPPQSGAAMDLDSPRPAPFPSRAVDLRSAANPGWEDPLQTLRPSRVERAATRDRDASTPSSGPSFSDAMRRVALGAATGEGWEDPAAELDLVDAAAEPEPEVAPAPSTEPQSGSSGTLAQPILLGRELAMEIAVQVGAPVQLITPIGRMTPAGRLPGVLATRVGGVFYSGMYEYDRKNVYIPLGVAQAFLRTGDRISGIEIKLDDIDELAAGQQAVDKIVRAAGRHDELVVETWLDLNRNLFAAMFLEKLAMFIALLFVVLVASFGILASNLMSVLEKAKEIAILKAMGSNDQLIRDVFVREGLCMGLLGAICGILVGLGLCLALARYGFPINEDVYYFERLPVVVNPVEVLIVGAAALVIVWGSSLYPARVASRMRPVDGLRQGE
ncbi:MAG: FtsX-like permease family protein [Myxococcales bacterium FL481]|nr:MAG: FtsX-like permease family protein [Myxococcales bacterium FL481]